MTTKSEALRITELDFQSIRENLKNYLRSQSEFTDYDFEGSGMAVILDLLAYNTHYMAMNLNLVGNEMFLDTAQIRASVISHAKMLNYVPSSRNGATATVNITVTPGPNESNTETTLVLDRYNRFLTKTIDGVSYNFVNLESASTSKTANGTFEFTNIVLKQGEVITDQFLVKPENSRRVFELPSANVDITTVQVRVQDSVANTYTEVYNKADDLTEITPESKVYFIEENSIKTGTYSIYFGDGIIGKALTDGNVVLVDYIDTQGEVANKASVFTSVQPIGGYKENVAVTTVMSAAGGSEKESVESIRFKAPLWYTAQNRAVTKNDYEALLLKDYPNIESISVWGGEENDPPVYGKIFISMKPVDDYVITALEKERIIDDVIKTRSVMTVFPEIVDPDYTYIILRIAVNYDRSATTLDANQIQDLVRQAVLDYKRDELTGYDSQFRLSRLQRYIDNAHSSITSSSVKVYVQKRFEPTLGVYKNYTSNFNIPLKRGGLIDNRLYSYPEFTVYDNLEIVRSVFIEEIPDSFTGISDIDITAPGLNYIEAPQVIISGDGSGATATAKIINGKVSTITLDTPGSNYTRATVTLVGGGGSGATATARLGTNIGRLRTYYFRVNGEKVVVNDQFGTIDYTTGKINILNFQPLSIAPNTLYKNTIITLNIQPYDDIISTLRNQILTIDEQDSSSIQITAVGE